MRIHSFIFCLPFLFFLSCSSGDKSGQAETDTVANTVTIDPNKTYTLKDAHVIGALQVSATGLGTFKKLDLDLENTSGSSLTVDLPAGIHFQNPNSNEQSLITAMSMGAIVLQSGERKVITVPTFCTNAKQQVPGKQSGWIYQPEYNGGLDEVISFYGDHALVINEWLEKKNPEKFSTDEGRMLFFQVVIWCHGGAQYDDIVNMLARDVFANDIDAARQWVDEVYKEAQEIAELIKKKDSEGIKKWCKQKLLELLPTNEQIEETARKTREGINKLRDRLSN